MTEEVFKNWEKRSSRSKKNFIVLKQKNAVDKIINFFMNSCWSKTGIFVKLMSKVSMKWKNWSDFRGLHSTQVQEKDWSKIMILSWNSLARYRNCEMKLIVWMIQEIFKMLNQYAVDIPTLPVNLCFSHLSRSWWNAKPFYSNAEPQRWAAKHLGHNMEFRETFFAIPDGSSSAPYPQELNPWSSHMSEPINSSVAEKNENRTPV